MNSWLLVNVAALCATTGWVVSMAIPSTKGVRLRNALLLRPANASEFDWTPSTAPSDFQVERTPAPLSFRNALSQAGLSGFGGDWDKALGLAGWLCKQAQDKGPIQADLDFTLSRIQQGFGYCADFVKVYLGLCHAAGIFARQWAFSFDGFGGHGHTLVEIFDRQRAKWLMVDVFNNFYPVDPTTDEPMSVMAFRDSLVGRRALARFVLCGPGRPGYTDLSKAYEYYRRGLEQWYMPWANAVFTYERSRLVRTSARISNALAQSIATILGTQPIVRPLRTETNEKLIDGLSRLRKRALMGFASSAGLTLLLVAQTTLAMARGAVLA